MLTNQNKILISHRGNITGKNPQKENTPEYIEAALKLGYNVEIDVWYLNNELFLGHDKGIYKTSLNFLQDDRLWCHCKNIEALRFLLDNDVHCFFHKSDDVTLTSKGFIWTFPGKRLVPRSFCVMPEYGYNGNLDECSGICSDFIEDYK